MSEPVDICKNCDHFREADEEYDQPNYCKLRFINIFDPESYSCSNFYSENLEVLGPEEKEGLIYAKVDGHKNEPLENCYNCDHFNEDHKEWDLSQYCKLREMRIFHREFAICLNFNLEGFERFGPKEITGPIWIDVAGLDLPSVPNSNEKMLAERCPVPDWAAYCFFENTGLGESWKKTFLAHQINQYEKGNLEIKDEEYSDGNLVRQMLLKMPFNISNGEVKKY